MTEEQDRMVEVQIYVRVRHKDGRIIGNSVSGVALHPGTVGLTQRAEFAAEGGAYAAARMRTHFELVDGDD